MRDTHATGIGSLMGAGLAGYCVGNLRLEGVVAPWEDPAFAYPDSLASPLQARCGPFHSARGALVSAQSLSGCERCRWCA
jgi:hypothetical protein